MMITLQSLGCKVPSALLLLKSCGYIKTKKSDSLSKTGLLNFFELFWEKWVVMDSNHRRHSQQIYSLPHLATLVTTLAFQKRLQRYCFYFVPPNILAFIFIFPFIFLLFVSFFLSIGRFCRLFLSKSVFFDEQPFGCTFVFFCRNDSFRLRFV